MTYPPNKVINLADYSIEDLVNLIKNAESMLEQKVAERKKEAKKEIKELASVYGFELNDLFENKRVKKSVPVKYRHPENPTLSWTGRGRQPNWLKEELETGKSINEFEVKN